MTNAIAAIDTSNYEAMARTMGISTEETSSSSRRSTLPRLRIIHSGIMGMTNIGGKSMKMEVIPGGAFKLEIPDGDTYYAKDIALRTFLQRFMYKRFIKGDVNSPNRFVKTVMAESLTNDLKDNDGGFNCGKPNGWVKDFKSLPAATQDLIRQIKRTRVVFGEVELIDPTDENGDAVEVKSLAAIWEVDNRTAFKTIGDVFGGLNKKRKLPVEHSIKISTAEVPLPNGSSYFVPETDVDMSNVLTVTDADQETFSGFMEWVTSYNEYIVRTWSEKNTDAMSEADAVLADDMSNIFEQEGGIPLS